MTKTKTKLSIVAVLGTAFAAAVAVGSLWMSRDADNICDLEDGLYCKKCKIGSCPHGDEGWLCCSGDPPVCAPMDGPAGDCMGISGKCLNYTVDESSGIATCHDQVE